MSIRSIGILGAGKVGIVLAQLAVKAGYTVYIAGSGDPQKIALSVSVLAPGATSYDKRTRCVKSDVVIAALPLSKYKTIPRKELSAGKLVIDAMNHWYEVDGPRSDTIHDTASSSETVQAFLSSSRVVKAFSHMGYHELFDETRPAGDAHRKAIAIAGDDSADITTVSNIVDTFGFDPVVIGTLHAGIHLEPGHDGFGANLSSDNLRSLLAL